MREQLKAVNDEVCALRALVADPTSPSGQPPEPPPLPAAHTPPPPQSQDLLDMVHPPDQDMENCENEDDLEWKAARRLAHWDRRNNMEVIKGYTKQRQERRLSVSKDVILEDDELSEHAESDAQSGKEIASMLCNIPHEKLLEVVQNCPASMLQQFIAERNCTYCASSCFNSSGFLWGSASRPRCGNQAKKARSFKVSIFLVVILSQVSKRLAVFCVLRPRPLSQVLWQVQVSGSAVFFFSGSSSHSSETVDGDLYATAGILAGPRCYPPCGQLALVVRVEGCQDRGAQTMCPFR